MKQNGNEEFDLKKVEEQAAELEKDLIVKELETLDVLEELATTKRTVEELKRQIQREASKCLTVPSDFHSDEHMPLPAIKEMDREHKCNPVTEYKLMMGNSSPCPTSPDLILMELKQAKLNLGKTIGDLGMIQNSVDSLNKKMKKEKNIIEKNQERLTLKFPGVLSMEEEPESIKLKPQITVDHAEMNYGFERCNNGSREYHQLLNVDQVAKSEVSRAMLANEQHKNSIHTAEMRLVAAKKMEEAAKAAEAVALAEIKALTGIKHSDGFPLPEPERMSFAFKVQSPLNLRAPEAAGWSNKKLVDAMQQMSEANASKMSILKRMKEAAEEVKCSKQALADALTRIELANRKQFAAENALHRWIPEHDESEKVNYSSTNLSILYPSERDSPLNEAKKSGPKPVLKTTVSMRDVLSRKPVQSEDDYVAHKEVNGHNEKHKVALSEMLHALREDLAFPAKPEKDRSDQKQFLPQRKKFGFIHISLPMPKPSKKKMQALNAI